MKTFLRPTTSLCPAVRGLFTSALFSWAIAGAEWPVTLATSDGAEMLLVPASPFLMGSHAVAPEESPPHQRHLPAFYVDRTEVTVAQYAAFVALTGHPAPADWTNGQPSAGLERRPMTNIRWTDAMRYALWAGKRLPTEAEWEKAARGTDGRRYPWGNADEESCRNRDTGKLRPVGTYPTGASPYGCLDMSGNAWEWTADWFAAYPESNARSAHFGRDYKVIRGGGGEYLYATVNLGTTVQRARMVPYGAHDFIGFRCVKDAPGQSPPYDAAAWLREAETLAETALRPPRTLTHEREFAALAASGRVPVRVAGGPDQSGLVTMGFPLPRGRLREVNDLRLLDARGNFRPLAAAPLAWWPDGSVRWALLRFPGTSGETVTVQLGRAPFTSLPAPEPGLRVSTNGAGFHIDTGTMMVEVDKKSLLGAVHRGDQIVCRQMEVSLTLSNRSELRILRAGPAEDFQIESHSPLHADLRWRGRFVDQQEKPGPMTYDLRLRAEAGSPQLRLWLTVVHAVGREKPWEEFKPQVALTDCRVVFRVDRAAREVRFGGEGGAFVFTNEASIELIQPNDLEYRVLAGGRELHRGTRASGWVTVRQAPQSSVMLGLRHFWQNHPQGLFTQDDRIGVAFWAGDAPMLWEGGLAKTHELVLEVNGESVGAPTLDPLLGIPPPNWLCGTEAAGALLPRNEQALRQLGYWEGWREEAMRRWVNAMPTGWRDFGDAYMGGPYKGKNAYANLEYDVALNFLHQFLRTGDRWYFEAVGPMVRHQADVDTENVAGFAWKHSPAHTTTEAEFGHVFLRGLLLHHLLTGDPRDREMAERLGDWIAGDLLRGRGTGNERQIGWSLYALTALHEVTRKPLYLEAARGLCERLAREQSPTGRFNIRWDNRIAFFNGIALSGMLGVQELAPDPALETALWRVAQRTLGLYPEYAGRTLNAWCWAIGQSGDPRFIHNLERTWISSLEFLLDRDCTTAETHAWRFPSFAVRYDLFPPFDGDPGELPRPDGWRALRFKNRTVHLYLRTRDAQAVPVVIVREGLAGGTAELSSAEGRLLQRVDFNQTGRLVQSACLKVPAVSPWCRLRLASPDAYAWQVQHDSRMAVTVADPKAEQLSWLLPHAVGSLAEGTREVVVRLEATGEGFHGATLYDPQGVPVRRVQRFVDFEDPGRYEMELKATVAGPRTGWSLELNAVKVLRAEGFLPYWSAGAEDWFDPEKPQ